MCSDMATESGRDKEPRESDANLGVQRSEDGQQVLVMLSSNGEHATHPEETCANVSTNVVNANQLHTKRFVSL
jgi:hypothetical protein